MRGNGGAPTLDNPTVSLATPGAAPIGVPNFFIDKFRIPPFLLSIYQAAGIEYGVRWEVLAAINEIETDYGRNLNVSTAGALGWMQFMPATWKAYGVDANGDKKKDPYNPVDAIFAAARYLKAAGADKDLARAIFAYNHADWYVDSVLMRARLIGGMPSDLVGSLTGLTQGMFPVHARARYADDVSEKEATRRVAKGQNAAIPVESSEKRRGIDIYAKSGSPVIAVQDGRIVKMGRSERLGNYIKLRDAYGNTYTYARLKSLATKHPVPKKVDVSQDDIAQELKLPKDDPKPKQPASAGTQKRKTKTKAARRRRRRPTRPVARRGQVQQGAPLREPEAPGRVQGRRRGAARRGRHGHEREGLPRLLRPRLRPRPRGRPAQEAEGRLEGHRRHDPRPHRPHVGRGGAARALRDPPGRPRRPADRPEADPRRLEAPRVHRDLPRQGQEPVLRLRRPDARRSARSC